MSNNVNLVIDAVIFKMSDKLDNDQLTFLEATLLVSFRGFKLERECTAVSTVSHDWEYYLSRFRANKRLKNCAEGTLKQYEFAIKKLREYINKNPQEYETNDIKLFLSLYGSHVDPIKHKMPSKNYLNSIKNYLSAFFDWMSEEGYISKNPVASVPKIKVPKQIKHAYSGSDMEKLKGVATNNRDIALIHFLDATGLRIGEALSIDQDQINWDAMSIVVYGTKGKAEREVFFTEECAYHLRKYLNSRTDDNSALFVGKIKPYNRLTVSGAEYILRTLGNGSDVYAHPHRFRRTMITRCNRRGMNLQDIQKLAGHANAQTTQVYIDMQNDAIRASYARIN